MEQRFGETQVCAVGTYTTYQLKAALTDFAKLYGVSIPTVRRLSKMINGLDDKTPEDFFRVACKSAEMKTFVNKYPELINMIFLVLGQPKAASIHACAMMIFPQEKTMFQWTPIRKQNDIMVSEWEGGELDEAGFLKEDILGIEQLSKFTDILNLIKQNEGKQIDLYKDVSLKDPEVFDAFCNGFTQDLFHFGAKGLSRYVVKVQPRSIDDLIACICLYRPGPMENGYHEKFLLRREGSEKIEYPIGAEDILKDSFGLCVTQEQIMLMCQKLAGFTLQHSDDVRKSMSKKKIAQLKDMRLEFVEGYVERYKDQGVDEEYANELWSQMEEFGKYGFNKSHAAAYSINGYNSMWLKVHYPVEFWSVAFSRASKDEYPFYINEIMRSNNIQLKSVNINKSDINIVVDPDDGALYWAINSVYQVGEKAQQQISEERKKNGPYFSLDEFIDRHVFKGSAVNKSVIENLIMCGAFDDLSEGPTIVEKREGLLRKYREQYSVKVNEEKDEFEKAIRARSGDKSKEEWWWQLQQKKRSGFSFFNYKSLCRRYFDNLNLKNRSFCDLARNIDDFKDSYQVAVLGGYVLECEIKDSRKGRFARVLLESNYSIIKVIVYAEIFPDFEELLQDCEKTILLLDGKILYSEYDEDYVVQTVKSTKIVKLTLD